MSDTQRRVSSCSPSYITIEPFFSKTSRKSPFLAPFVLENSESSSFVRFDEKTMTSRSDLSSSSSAMRAVTSLSALSTTLFVSLPIIFRLASSYSVIPPLCQSR